VGERDHAVALDDVATAKWEQRGERPFGGIEPGDPGGHALGAAPHPAGGDVVAGAVPGAHKATVLVDGAVREVGPKMPAPTAHGEQLRAGVADGPPATYPNGSGRQVAGSPGFLCVSHAPILAQSVADVCNNNADYADGRGCRRAAPFVPGSGARSASRTWNCV